VRVADGRFLTAAGGKGCLYIFCLLFVVVFFFFLFCFVVNGDQRGCPPRTKRKLGPGLPRTGLFLISGCLRGGRVGPSSGRGCLVMRDSGRSIETGWVAEAVQKKKAPASRGAALRGVKGRPMRADRWWSAGNYWL